MARLDERDYTYVTTVRGMCRDCRQIVPARVFVRDGNVWQQSLCPRCRPSPPPALIASDAQWYLENVLRAFPDSSPIAGSHPPRRGCPHDCGPCSWHASPCQLPVISITNACNLRCPICFTYNRRDRLYHISVDEMRRTVDAMLAATGPVDVIDITGGEPTLHPQIIEILECCRRPEIGRITMNSNGLRLAEDRELCRRLADLGIYVVLSFNTFDRDTAIRLHGVDVLDAKLRAIENLTLAGVRMTLLNVMTRGVNEDAAGGILDLMRGNDNILSLTVQTMTYTGQGAGRLPERRHVPVDEAARLVSLHSNGDLEFGDFLSRPSAHPLCYLICYMLKSGGKLLPFARFAPRDKLAALMRDSYLMRLQDERAFFDDVIGDLYARGETAHLRVFRDLVGKLYPTDRVIGPFERQRIAESAVRTVYVHTHMDEDTFDCSRAMLCPDLVPCGPDGGMIPACNYNLFYRMQDDRFYVEGDGG